ncbi:mitoguardin isoform X1 [Diprion similis]|uniref:mitoguardin isoform X1 n=1 Tax=Diprion similis TaxID=362088 RepID=UPI001EF77150|nr:mitoguardin isoform X1 [Diprion similis]
MMSIFNVKNMIGQFNPKFVITLPSINLSRTQKILIICLTSGTLLLGGLAQFLKRRRRHPASFARRYPRDVRHKYINGKGSNLDAVSQVSWARRSEASTRSHVSDRASLISSVPGGPDGDVKLTPQQYGVLGLEALERAIYCWEDALTAFSSSLNCGDALALPSKADAAFTHDVQELLDLGYHIQSTAELLFIDQHSVLFRNESDAGSEESRKQSVSGTRASSTLRDKQDAASSPESFESARDGVADLREFEEFSEFFPHFEKQKLYHTALKQHEDKGIPCRKLHTELVKCGSDVEYLAKVHCLRQAFSRLFAWPAAASWIADMGRQLITDLIVYADRDPKEYITHYEAMLDFLQDPSKRSMMQEELSGRNVKCINFYDVLIDFILLDAFDEVEKPPSSIKAILQNRWISASFRETAIGTAVWSVLMGKRQMLKYNKGFLAHFYSISEQISPVLVWGFLGPEGSLRATCYYFREQVVEFLVDIFNFFKVRYTTVDELAEDILREIKTRVGNINQRLSLEGC